MSRFERIEERLVSLEDKKDKKKKSWKIPFSVKSSAKKAEKRDDLILVFYLSQKYQISWKLCNIVSGNMVVINNKAHEINPKAIWRMGKYIVYIIREIDRLPVSNEDYEKIKKRKTDTDADVPLIKAVLGAQIKKQPLSGKSKWVAIIIIVIIAIIVGTIFFK